MKFAPGAWRYAILPLLATPFAILFSVKVAIASFLVGIGTLAFFRDPERTPPPTGVVSPADGKVSVIRTEGERQRVGVFMNVHNVHVVRAPFDATVADVERSPGGYKPAFSKDSDLNEKVHVRLELADPSLPEADETTTDADATVAVEPDATEGRSDAADATDGGAGGAGAEVTFIAGAFARRIHPYVEAGDELDRGDRIGHIAFGSRVDVLFPSGVGRDGIAVEMGERVIAGESVLFATDDPLAEPTDTGDETNLADDGEPFGSE